MPDSQPTVLLVDDETPIRSALRRIVMRAGCTPLEASSAAEAIEQVESAREISAAILDYNMPERTGLDLARELRCRYPDVPVMLLSGGMANDEIREAIESGLVWAYASKPWSLSWMKEAIAAMIRRDPPPPRG